MAFRIQLLFALCLLSLYDVNAFVAGNRPKQPQLTSFSWKQCGPSTDPAHVKSLSVSPDPLKFPGNLTISTVATLDKAEGVADVQLAVLMEKKIAGFYIKIPCIANLGSCTYNDLCKDWAAVCPQYAKFGIPCTCPIPANTYTVDGLVADVTTKLPPGSSGDLRITGNIQSPTAGHIFCLQIEITIA